MDRQYSSAFDSKKNDLNEINLLVFYIKYPKQKNTPTFKIQNEIEKIIKQKNYNVIFPETELTIYDLVKEYLHSFKEYRKVKGWSKLKSFRDLFLINKINRGLNLLRNSVVYLTKQQEKAAAEEKL